MDNPIFNQYWHAYFLRLPRRIKQIVMALADMFCLILSLWAAFALRFSDWWPEKELINAWPLFIFLPLFGVLTLGCLGLYRAIIRYVNLRLMATIAIGVLTVVAGAYALRVVFSAYAIPRSVPIIFGLSAWLYIGGSRLIVRSYYHWITNKKRTKRVLIFGAGFAGRQLLSFLSNDQEMRVVGFVDDDPKLARTTLAGVMVFPANNLGEMIERLYVDTVLIALPNVSGAQRRAVLQRLIDYPVHVKTIPPMSEILSGAGVDKVRELDIEDLLARDVVRPLSHLMLKSLKNKSVCITGAGGSIGSELARQCVKQGVKKLVLFDNSEFALFSIERELLEHVVDPCEIVAILGSVTDTHLMLKVLANHGVQTVYHAAAYKHVPMVEHNPFVGVFNNVWGTRAAADAAVKAGVERFILISTDKAVRPTNVMGATKRLSELALQALAAEPGVKTVFSMVRFGNVLDSSGSVVPMFRRQIAEGGPVRVTHENIHRFFMTIPEAASLVIQAGSMGIGGEVFVLHMGEPVRIANLAEMMIKLSGYTVKNDQHPEGDIEIVFTGLRPGEKLYEELLVDDQAFNTSHEKIFCAREAFIPLKQLEAVFDRIQEAAKQDDVRQLKQILSEVVAGYVYSDAGTTSSNVVKLQFG
jgi:FlaA1/EpsC-like NDP-sugar epimerase